MKKGNTQSPKRSINKRNPNEARKGDPVPILRYIVTCIVSPEKAEDAVDQFLNEGFVIKEVEEKTIKRRKNSDEYAKGESEFKDVPVVEIVAHSHPVRKKELIALKNKIEAGK